MTKYAVVGQTREREIIPHQQIVTDDLKVGDIVYIAATVAAPLTSWYRVYDGGDKGLRFWNVTSSYCEAVTQYDAECERLAAQKQDDYDRAWVADNSEDDDWRDTQVEQERDYEATYY